jgi:hypothetical protein
MRVGIELVGRSSMHVMHSYLCHIQVSHDLDPTPYPVYAGQDIISHSSQGRPNNSFRSCLASFETPQYCKEGTEGGKICETSKDAIFDQALASVRHVPVTVSREHATQCKVDLRPSAKRS